MLQIDTENSATGDTNESTLVFFRFFGNKLLLFEKQLKARSNLTIPQNNSEDAIKKIEMSVHLKTFRTDGTYLPHGWLQISLSLSLSFF